jgi:signal transduction histidine kinase
MEQLRRAAEDITGGADLRRRIDIGPGKDEMHRLAETFNNMFARLENSFEVEKQFVADASHELRTPAGVILAQSEFALSQDDPGEKDEALIAIQRQAKKMEKLIQSLLLLARLERGMEEMPLERLDFSALLQELCDDFALTLERDIALEQNIAPDIFVKGSKELLARLALNLFSNALRYGRLGGHIWVTLAQESTAAVLRVRDDGAGIAPAHLPNIWRRFYQADPARSQGSGLGLSMVRGIAGLHGGSVSCTSHEGAGSEFELRLPLTKL